MKHLKLWAVMPLLLAALAIAGCTQSAPPSPTPPAPEKSAPQAAAPTPTSATAAQSEAKLAPQAAAPGSLPPDHWLVGTSPVEDMVPATIAESAPRTLIAEHGPAYLERVGITRVLHLKGTPYEMGLQHGALLKDEINEGAALLKLVGNAALKEKYAVTLREAWQRTSPFIPDKYKEEIRGLSESTGIPLEDVQDFTIFPELFHCSGFAFWGKATADGALLHGRVLDYMRDAGMDKFALIIVHEPSEGHATVNIAYSGMLGSVTGMNAEHVCIGEMGGRGEGKWDGMPMSILLREALETCGTLDAAKEFFAKTKRTCQYYYVISDSKANNGVGSAVGVAAEPDSIQFVDPNQAVPQLPRPVEDAVLLSADERYNCLVDRVQKQYGKITPQIALDVMARGVAMKSNMHDVLFKPATLEFWVANSTIDAPACNLPYTHHNLDTLMKEKPAK